MKKYFLTGLVILLPITLTVLIFIYLIDLFTNPLVDVVKELAVFLPQSFENHQHLVIFLARLASLVILLGFTTLIGFLAHRFFFSQLVKLTNYTLSRIPIIKPIYITLEKLTRMIFSQEKKIFKKTVLLPFPNPSVRALGFLTGSSPAFVSEKNPQITEMVFMPTAPHPFSGFLIFCPKNLVEEVDFSLEDSMKFLISCGVVHPEDKDERV